MKKKLLAMLALSAVLAMSAGLMAACTDPEDDDPDTPCTEHVDSDNDGKCDNCGEDMGGEPVTPPEETKITDGVFSNQMDSSHEALIKLYEDGTAYLSGFTVSYKGWYEVKEESITTAATAPDGTIIDPAAEADGKGKCEWLTFDTAIYFWADEEMTEPITVNASAEAEDDLPSPAVGYAYGTPANALAYDSENDMIYNYKFDQATRTLSHSSLRDFTTEDEAPIELYRFMLKNESDIPADAEEGAVISDFTLLITHKSFEGNLLGGSNVWNGKYEQEGNVYTLNDTFSGGEVGTLTIAEDGASATFTNGTVTLELIPYEEVTSGEVEDLVVANASINVGIEIPFTLTFRSDCTAVLSASVMGSSVEITTDWTLDGYTISFENTSAGEFTYAIDADGAHVTWKGDLSDRMTDVTVPFTFASSELAKLQDARPAAPEVLGTLTGGGGSFVMTLSLYEDNTCAVSMGDTQITTGSWSFANYALTVTLEGQEPATSDPSKLQDVGIVVDLIVGSSGSSVTFTGPNTLVGVLG